MRVLVYDKIGKTHGTVFSTPVRDLGTLTTERRTKDSIRKEILSIVDDACKGNLDPDYVKTAIETSQILVVLYLDTEERKEGRGGRITLQTHSKPVGFMIAYPKPNKELYADVLCSSVPGGGSELLNFGIKYARISGYKSVGLSTMPTVLAYYPEFGFEYRQGCRTGEDVMATIPKSLHSYIRTVKETIKQAKGEKRPVSIRLPTTSEEAYDTPEFMNFILDLHRKGLSVKQHEGCDRLNLTAKEIKDLDCGQDGYTMKLCFPTTPVRVSPSSPLPNNNDVEMYIPPSPTTSQTRRRKSKTRGTRGKTPSKTRSKTRRNTRRAM